MQWQVIHFQLYQHLNISVGKKVLYTFCHWQTTVIYSDIDKKIVVQNINIYLHELLPSEQNISSDNMETSFEIFASKFWLRISKETHMQRWKEMKYILKVILVKSLKVKRLSFITTSKMIKHSKEHSNPVAVSSF